MPRKVALLIGVSRYEDARLQQLGAPAADVAALGEALRDPAIAGFDEVTTLIEPTFDEMKMAVNALCHKRDPKDLILFYYSGHGIRDDKGCLFFALEATQYDLPRATSFPASYLKEFVDDCRSRRQVLIFDCCHAGAFMEGKAAASGTLAVTEDTFEVRGFGREILAATNATAYAFEGEVAKGDGTSRKLGRFTRHLVEALQTGAGDNSREEVSVADLFEHARRCLAAEEPRMRPQHWRERGEEPLVIARNPMARARLPADILLALGDGNWLTRRGAVDVLRNYVIGTEPRLREAAIAELRRREPDEEHRRVHERIREVLAMVATMSVSSGEVLAAVVPKSDPSCRASSTVLRDVDTSLCPELVVIPPGRFVMGSPDGKEFLGSAELPQHEVTIARSFALGRFPVTRGEFAAFFEATKRPMKGMYCWNGKASKFAEEADWRTPGFDQSDRDPVVGVSWEDATAYCRWLSKRLGQTYRLPSEAEWEYACRAGTTTPFWTGDTISTDQANYDGNQVYGAGRKGVWRQRTVAVDDPAFRPNPFGLFHMHGNVFEWVEDRWHNDYIGAPSDGRPWIKGFWLYGLGPGRVVRGGSWFMAPQFARSAFRMGTEPGERSVYVGFRVARTLTP